MDCGVPRKTGCCLKQCAAVDLVFIRMYRFDGIVCAHFLLPIQRIHAHFANESIHSV